MVFVVWNNSLTSQLQLVWFNYGLMFVKDVMKSCHTAFPHTPLHQLWDEMVTKYLFLVPVIDKNKRLQGVVVPIDLLRLPELSGMQQRHMHHKNAEIAKILKKNPKKKVFEVMNPRYIFTHPTTPVMRALSRMMVRNVSTLPVLDEQSYLLGVVNKTTIFHSMMKFKI